MYRRYTITFLMRNLFKHETDPSLEGFERGHLTSTGAVTVDTGIFTGRSPKDKYIVKESENEGEYLVEKRAAEIF